MAARGGGLKAVPKNGYEFIQSLMHELFLNLSKTPVVLTHETAVVTGKG